MWYLFFIVLGLALGSFINVLVLRLKEEKSLLGRSVCPKCSHQLSWFDNIPVFSFLFLKAKCRHCQEPISWQYPLVEIASGLLWLTAYIYFITQGIEAVFIYGFYFSILLSLFVFDLRWMLLPDAITLPAIFLAFIINWYLGFTLVLMLISGALGAGWFGIQYALSRGKWVGSGDIILGGLIGLMVGSWEHLLIVIFLAYILGSVIAVGLLFTGKKKLGAQLPMGVFLTLATVVAMVWGGQIWGWYTAFLW